VRVRPPLPAPKKGRPQGSPFFGAHSGGLRKDIFQISAEQEIRREERRQTRFGETVRR